MKLEDTYVMLVLAVIGAALIGLLLIYAENNGDKDYRLIIKEVVKQECLR